ncbi:VCBS repeat-containing protein [Myxococcus stipitatus]|uniref:FG-GAP repeat domain-containing protein n=1 Tax=Myxococcus stipitatus TaxID=83455 RepID=UPI001F2A5C76|nr:VCBS repeat-containing protein [Myxococcus stipitatus]MCE9670286.1 VCBS repeat-containing protein [Myxococcus stipitatus]
MFKKALVAALFLAPIASSEARDGISHGSDTTADVTGDGLDDFIYFESDRTLKVAASNGTTFTYKTTWSSTAFDESFGAWFADVTGDGRADAIGIRDYNDGTAIRVIVRRSNGSSFLPEEEWYNETGWSGWTRFDFKDVTGDGKADFILNRNIPGGDGLNVAISNGNGFNTRTAWTLDAVVADREIYYEDVTGDGKADAVVHHVNSILVRPSTGTSFGPESTWLSVAFNGTKGVWVSDVTGDGRADFIVENADGVQVRASSGTSFLGSGYWTAPLGGNLPTWIARVNNDNRSDIIYRYYLLQNCIPQPTCNGWGRVRHSDGATFLSTVHWY